MQRRPGERRRAERLQSRQGAVIGVFPQARQALENAIETVILNTASVKDALDATDKEVSGAIQQYNRTSSL